MVVDCLRDADVIEIGAAAQIADLVTTFGIEWD